MFRVALIGFMFTLSSAFIPQFVYYKTPSSKIIMDGKGFGGGEATRDPSPTLYDLNDPKGKQTAIFKADSFAEYLAKRSSTNNHGAATGQQPVVVNEVKSGVTNNAESYAAYMEKRKAQYASKFQNQNNRGNEHDN